MATLASLQLDAAGNPYEKETRPMLSRTAVRLTPAPTLVQVRPLPLPAPIPTPDSAARPMEPLPPAPSTKDPMVYAPPSPAMVAERKTNYLMWGLIAGALIGAYLLWRK